MTAPPGSAGAHDALFVPDGDRLVPTDLARGPWSPDALHGGPVAALLAGALDAMPADDPMHLARFTVELLRPVPVAPLTVSTRLARPGRKVQLLEATLSDGERDLAWMRALRVRRRPEDGPDPDADRVGPDATAARPPGPDQGYATPSPVEGYAAFHNAGAELRYVAGAFDVPGPSTVWVRLTVPVVAGELATPLQRVAGAADFGNGVSNVLDFRRWLFINPDLTVYLLRPAQGEWVCLDAVTALGTPGTAVALSELFDADGPLGRATQSLLVEPRG